MISYFLHFEKCHFCKHERMSSILWIPASYGKCAVPSFDVNVTCAGSPLWSKERTEAIVVQMGVSLVLQCRPPAGLPPPVIFWMDNSESFAHMVQGHRTFTFNRTMPDKQRTNKTKHSLGNHLLTL